MQTAILVKGLSLAQEARIIRKLENARRQSAKYAREKQRAIELATAVKVGTVADYPVYHAKSLSLLVATERPGMRREIPRPYQCQEPSVRSSAKDGGRQDS